MMRNIKEYILIIFNIIILIMMCSKNSIPWVSSNGKETFINYYSYFDVIVFGGGNIFALPSAILNIILIILNLLTLLFKHKNLKNVYFFVELLFIFFFIPSVFLTGSVTIFQWIILAIVVIKCIINIIFYLKINLKYKFR